MVRAVGNRLYIFPVGRNPENHVAAMTPGDLVLNPQTAGHYLISYQWETSATTSSDMMLVSESNPIILTVNSRGARAWRRTMFGKIRKMGFCGAENTLVDIFQNHAGDGSDGMEILKTLLKNWAQQAGYDYDPNHYRDTRSAIVALLYPLYRDIYMDWLSPEGILNPVSLWFPYALKSFKKAVKILTGYDTPQMLKVLGKNLMSNQSHQNIQMTPATQYVYAAADIANMNATGAINGVTYYSNSAYMTVVNPLYSVNHFGITMAAIFKDLLPVDITYEIIQYGAELLYPIDLMSILTIREFLICLAPAERLRFARKIAEYWGKPEQQLSVPEPMPQNVMLAAGGDGVYNLTINNNVSFNTVGYADMTYILRDTARMYVEYKDKMVLPKKYKTVLELHDVVARQHTQYQEEKLNQPIEYPEWVLALENHVVNGLRIHLARHTSELTQWGQKLGHCIASYRERAIAQKCILLALFRGDELVYNAELEYDGSVKYTESDLYHRAHAVAASLSKDTVDPYHATGLTYIQLRGKGNASATPEDDKVFREALKQVVRTGGLPYNTEMELTAGGMT
jgi:hypothetical protein